MMNAASRYIPLLAIALTGALSVVEVVHWNGHRQHNRPHHGQLANAYFVVRAGECEGVFDFLSMFERPEIAQRLYFDGIYVLGNATDSATVSDIARAHDLHITIRRAGFGLTQQRRALGYAGAVLVIADQDERVLYARGVPSSSAEHEALAALLTSSPL